MLKVETRLVDKRRYHWRQVALVVAFVVFVSPVLAQPAGRGEFLAANQNHSTYKELFTAPKPRNVPFSLVIQGNNNRTDDRVNATLLAIGALALIGGTYAIVDEGVRSRTAWILYGGAMVVGTAVVVRVKLQNRKRR